MGIEQSTTAQLDHTLIDHLVTRAEDILVQTSMSALDVPPNRCVTIGDRAFGVSGPRVWNSLPPDITTSPSLACFKQRLIMLLFQPALHSHVGLRDTDIFFTVKCSRSFYLDLFMAL